MHILREIDRLSFSIAGTRFMKNQRLGLISIALCLVLASASSGAESVAGLQLADYRGKVVVVDFWASWCVPCRRSFPWMNTMQARYGDRGLVVVGVNVDRERAAADRFLAEVPADFRIHFDSEGRLAEEFGVEAMPSSYVIGRDGEIVARHLGFKVRNQDEYEALLVDALGDMQ
jgi:cytochrome c biogenesis protein CcmG/thiol:disulfide interchange protein DsbE